MISIAKIPQSLSSSLPLEPRNEVAVLFGPCVSPYTLFFLAHQKLMHDLI